MNALVGMSIWRKAMEHPVTTSCVHMRGTRGLYAHMFPTSEELEAIRYHAVCAKDGETVHHLGYEEAIASGHTVYFKNVGRKVRAIDEEVTRIRVAKFARRWQAALVYGVGYSIGYDFHADDTELVVMQLAGQKVWSFEGAPTVVMNDGDLLVVPKNLRHIAIPIGWSVHVTVGLDC